MAKRNSTSLVVSDGPPVTHFASTRGVGRPPRALIGENMKLPATAYDISIVDMSVQWMSSRYEADLVLQKAGIGRTGLRPLLYDDEISQCLEQRFDAMMSRGYSLTCDDEAVAEKVRKELDNVYRDLMQGLFNALGFGYSVVEIVYRPPHEKRLTEDLDFGLTKALEVPFEWFDFSNNELYHKFPNFTAVDPRKFIYALRQPSFRNPRGEALLSRLYWVWFFRTHGWQFWMKALERCGVPFLVGKTQAADKQAAAAALFNAVQNAVLAIGPDDSVESLEMGKNSDVFPAFDAATQARIQKMILGQTLTSGTGSAQSGGGGGGNRSLGEVHEHTMERKVSNDAEMVRRPVQTVVDVITFMNGLPPCVFAINPPLYVNAGQATRDVALKGAGIVVEFSEEYLQRSYGFRKGEIIKGDKDTVPVGSTGKPATGGNESKTAPAKAAA